MSSTIDTSAVYGKDPAGTIYDYEMKLKHGELSFSS